MWEEIQVVSKISRGNACSLKEGEKKPKKRWENVIASNIWKIGIN